MRKEIADLKQKTESQQKKIQLLKEAIVTGKKNGFIGFLIFSWIGGEKVNDERNGI